METRHLFYTLKMIWNHTVPEEMQLKPFKKYRLNMSKDYLKDAVSCMVTELNTRRNLELYITEIIKIENYRLILNERMFNEDLLSIGN
ncbi:MAG: hypothetical protein GY834_10670 [Bacteroidetes bacterium]|nr:hypothetical protein [Bacteroidota bacterium]